MQTTIETTISKLDQMGMIPSGLNMPLDMKITDARATRYDYYGNKYAESNEHYENKALSLKIEHSQIANPFWITIFEGATYREESTRCIIATLEETINENFDLVTANGTVYKDECVTQDDENIEGLDIIKEVVFAFKCKIYDGDESGLYAEYATTEDNCDVLNDAVEELIEMNFIEINERFSKINPNTNEIRELATTINDICSGKLYTVTVVCDSCIRAVDKYLTQEEAEKLFLKYCLEWYSDSGVERYLNVLGLESFEELSITQWESYFHSDAWYDVDDMSNVEIKKM